MSGDVGSNVVTFRLAFGDGAARGVAACVAWSLILNRVNDIPPKDPAVMDLVESLMTIPTNFELHGDGSERAALVAQAARQNQAAQALPVNTIEWIGMVVEYAGLTIGSTPVAGTALLRHLDQMMQAYNEHPDVESYATEAPAKRLRRSRGKSSGPMDAEAEEDGYDRGLKIGTRRIIAMRSFLSAGTASGLDILREHLQWVGDVRLSVLSDDVLRQKWFYVGSVAPKDEEQGASQGLMRPEAYVPKGAKFATMLHDSPLTAQQFDKMLLKAIKVYEEDTAHLDRDDLRAKFKPKEEQWLQYRRVVQQWDLSMAEVCRADLAAEEFELLQDAILRSRSMDKEVLSMLLRRPAVFHIGMLPTLSAREVQVDDAARQVQQAHVEASQSKFKVLEAELQADWASLLELQLGSQQLSELLRWLDLEHRRTQAATAEALVDRYLRKAFPVCNVASWRDMPGQLAMLAKLWDAERQGQVGARRAVVLLDFNTPHSRDSLRLPGLIAAIASTAKACGPTETGVVAWMPNLSKESSSKTV
jgi:hypothetical protein